MSETLKSKAKKVFRKDKGDLSKLIKPRNLNEDLKDNMRLDNQWKVYIRLNDGLKNILAAFLILFIPNLVMILTFTVLHCKSSYTILFQFITSNSFFVSLKAIWFYGQIDVLFGFSVIIAYMWFALLLMVLVPGRIVSGPLTPNGNVPKYKDNGFICFLLTMVLFAILQFILSFNTPYSVSIVYLKLPSLIFCTIIFSYIFCFFLYIKGLYFPSSSDKGSSGYFFFDYYWGTELHPRICGIDLKIFTNCRFGMTVWALLILCYLMYSFELDKLHGGQIVNAALQLMYITKFFWWEAGYYSTIDIMLDRAGFYICWGCLSFIASMYTLSSFYMASVAIDMHLSYYIAIFIFGVSSLVVNYWADHQKQVFRATNGNCLIWGKAPVMIVAKYTDHNGGTQKSLLLVSGFWGMARHFHYLPELTLAFSWCAASGFHHLLPFTYVIFLAILLVHRVERDDEKCSIKYGSYYSKYKKMVPYKIIPYVY